MSIVDSLDPRLTEPQVDYSAVIDGPRGPEIAPRYESMACAQKRYVLALWRAGEPTLAQRAALCYRSGTVFSECPKGMIASGYKHRCGDPLCVTCSRSKIRFYAWAAKRDHTSFSVPATGIEFYSASPLREVFLTRVTTFLRGFYPSALISDAFDSRGQLSIRAVVPQTPVDRKDIQARWKRFGQLSVRYHDEPMQVYLWAFAGMVEAACMDADDKAALRISLKNTRMIRTIGTFYAPLSKEALAERRKESSHDRHTCPVCHEDHMRLIPLLERREESVEDAESRYAHGVHWGAELELLRVISKGDITYKFSNGYQIPFTSIAAAASPPS